MRGLLGKKIGMTRIFDDTGNMVPVTVLEAGPCVVTQLKTSRVDGYDAIQVGYLNKKPKHSNHAYIVFGKRFKSSKNYFNLSKKGDLKEAAANLYKIMRKIKKKGYKKIFVSKIPKEGPGIAINDRLLKASN